MQVSIRSFARCAALTLALVLPSIALAQDQARDFPSKPIRLIVGYAAGGGADITARLLADALTSVWTSPVVVVNQAGGTGNIATEAVARAEPDGYTLLHCTIASHAITPASKKLKVDHIRDFAPVSMIGSVPNVLVVNPSMPAKSLREFIAYAKANPGKLSYGSNGVGGSPHLSMELLKSLTGIDIVHIPYKGGSSALNDLIGGQIPAAAVTLAGAPATAIEAGKVRALGVTSAKRNKHAASIPTFAESGVAGYDVSSWHGICAPAGVPKLIIAKLNAGLVKVLSSPQLIQRLEDQGFEVTPGTPEQFAAHIQSETIKWQKVIREAGIQPE